MAYVPDPAGDPVAKVELRISCQHLINMDTFSKSDPMCVLYFRDERGSWIESGRTEMIKDNLNPKFVKAFTVDYHFEMVQDLRLVVVDIDAHTNDLSKQDFIGEIECKLADIVTSRDKKLVRELKNPKHPHSKRGYITVQAEEMKDLQYQVKFDLCGIQLDKKDLFGKSDPYLIFNEIRKSGQLEDIVPVMKTETLEPKWKPFTVSVQKICNGDFDRPLLIECFDWNRSTKHELIGNFRTSLRELLSGKKDFELINPKKKSKRSYRNSGTIHLNTAELIKTHTFLDYIAGGCDMSLIVAIDFTASNGNPGNPSSLHYLGSAMNDYATAITSVGNVLATYDSDGNFPVYGFGGQLRTPNGPQVSHCFPLNGRFDNPEVTGINGILDVYRQALSNVALSGPTCFEKIIGISAEIASTNSSQTQQKYYILLILTDGVINDMNETIDQVVRASGLPLSIVIVGVGNADFANMAILDADDNPLRDSRGQLMKRDIVQFVPMNQFKQSPAALSREVLAEIPSQLLASMKDRGYIPNPPSNRPLPTLNQSYYDLSQSSMNLGQPPQQMPMMQQQQPPMMQQQQPPMAQQQPPIQSNYPEFTAYNPSAPP